MKVKTRTDKMMDECALFSWRQSEEEHDRRGFSKYTYSTSHFTQRSKLHALQNYSSLKSRCRSIWRQWNFCCILALSRNVGQINWVPQFLIWHGGWFDKDDRPSSNKKWSNRMYWNTYSLWGYYQVLNCTSPSLQSFNVSWKLRAPEVTLSDKQGSNTCSIL